MTLNSGKPALLVNSQLFKNITEFITRCGICCVQIAT